MTTTKSQREHHLRSMRRGITIFEIVVAISLMTAAMLGITQLVFQVDRTRHAVDQRATALDELASRAERCLLLDAAAIDEKTIRDWPLSDAARQTLKNPTWEVVIEKSEEVYEGTSISLTLVHDDAGAISRRAGPITVWVFASADANSSQPTTEIAP